MSDDNFESEVEEVLETELDSLKARATQMGIKFHPSSGVDSLKAKINEALAEEVPEPEVEAEPVVGVSSERAKRAVLKKEQLKLRRVNVTCMNPAKSEYNGVIITVGNNLVGTVKRYVPFNVEWHVEDILYQNMKQAKYQHFYSERDPDTKRNVRKTKLAQCYNIMDLAPLTEKELADLSQRQALATGTEEA